MTKKTLIREWMDSHGIDYAVAHECGMFGAWEAGVEVLHAPYKNAEGEVFHRTRRFPDGTWKQPAGQGLRLWWPMEAKNLPVLLCEGEGDTLAALSAVWDTDTDTKPELLDAIVPVGLPGASMNPVAVVADLVLHNVPVVYLVLDADEAGKKATERIVKAAANVALEVIPLGLPPNYDLADYLQASSYGPPLEQLTNLLLDAEVHGETRREEIVMASIKDKLKINQKDSGAFNA